MPRYTFTTSVLRTPQAVDDTAALTADDWVIIDVLANDLGGRSTSLYSIDQSDLTSATLEGVQSLLGSGSTVWIENGQIVYDAGESFAALFRGQTAIDSFSYALQLGNGTLSLARVEVTIHGVATRVPGFSVTQIAGDAYNRAITVGDFNGDGKQDFLTASPWYGNSSVYLYLGNGDGTFDKAAAPIVSVPGLVRVRSEDLDADGNLDLITTNANDGTLSVALGDGAGNFSSLTTYLTPGGHDDATFGDVDEDGDLDVITQSGGQISLFRSDGSGGLAAAESLVSGPIGGATVVVDVNEDGLLDLVYFDGASQQINTRLGDGTGSFAAVNFSAAMPGGIGRTALGDINGDGNIDLVAAKAESVVVMLGDGSGSFTTGPSTEYVLGDLPLEVYLRDLNADGALDIIAPGYLEGQILVLYGLGDGSFENVTLYATGGVNPTEIGFADFNSDGLLDFISTNEGTHNLSVFLQDELF